MAVYNEIQVGRFNRFMQKLLGIKGGPPMKQLGSELMPVISHTSGVENRYLEGWDRYGTFGNQAGAAGQTAAVKLRNPANSNTILVIDKITVTGASGTYVTLEKGPSAVDYGTINSVIAIDTRGRPASTAICSQSGTGVAGLLYFEAFAPGATNYDFILTDDSEIEVMPGDFCQVRAQTVNVGVVVGFIWRERFLEDSERF